MNGTHITESMAVSYAAGFCGEGVALAIAAHLTYCPACRALVARREALLGALMATGDASSAAPPPVHQPGAPNADAPDGLPACLAARLDEIHDEPQPLAPLEAGPLPRVVAARIGVPYGEISWKFLLPGVSEHKIIDENGETTSLVRAKPGVSIPRHTHCADELTVIFDGVLEDGDHAYLPGDIILANADVEHGPRAGGDRPCVCLTALTGGVRFTGLFGRALNYLA